MAENSGTTLNGLTKNPLIVGNKDFRNKTSQALELIRNTSDDMWQMVTKYIRIIISAEITGGMKAWLKFPIFEVGQRTAESSLTWYASCICHDAYHSKLYNDYKEKLGDVPDNIWMGRLAENQCIDVQMQFLEQVNAPQEEKDHLRNMKNIDYFSKSVVRDW